MLAFIYIYMYVYIYTCVAVRLYMGHARSGEVSLMWGTKTTSYLILPVTDIICGGCGQ